MKGNVKDDSAKAREKSTNIVNPAIIPLFAVFPQFPNHSALRALCRAQGRRRSELVKQDNAPIVGVPIHLLQDQHVVADPLDLGDDAIVLPMPASPVERQNLHAGIPGGEILGEIKDGDLDDWISVPGLRVLHRDRAGVRDDRVGVLRGVVDRERELVHEAFVECEEGEPGRRRGEPQRGSGR